jgi:D-alanyl-D-alanine dipeptidase
MKHFITIIFSALILCAFNKAGAQDYSAVLHVENQAQYLKEAQADSNKKLVEIKKYIPGIVLDIRYATTNNFTHHVMYKQARAFARLPVVRALQQIEAELKTKGLGLKIYDAYRPYSVTVTFYEVTPDTNFVADPKKGSKHNRGCAVDLSLIDLKTRKELDMPTGFDSFSKKAAAEYADLPKEELANRELLKSVMQAHGFRVISTEWWHYDFNGWQNYPLLDVPFSAIK